LQVEEINEKVFLEDESNAENSNDSPANDDEQSEQL
jgi:hypothetical protein